ncbi:superoxide dismutase family protein [Streptomyces sp. NPDC090083]|uniref:superoxide dismutase family protein n=1 Tax=Streptomyces sp. NPDC090083 TaxID=3365941 RepID=UPI0038205317
MYHRTSARLSAPGTPPTTASPYRASRLVPAIALAAALLAGCGGGSAHHAAAKPQGSASAHDMDSMSGMAMGDPSATPADKIPNSTVVEGTFKLLDTRPPGLDHVKGTAWLAQGPQGTTVTVKLTGLQPGASYMAHLHAQHCSADNGGEHFQFVKGGPAMPPNEVHLMFTADKAGMGMTTVNNTRKTGKGAVAIVVHPSDALDNRIACADFDF